GQRLVASEIHAAKGRFALVLARRRLVEDVEDPGELAAHPLGDAVLVRDVVHADLRDEAFEPFLPPIFAHTPERLGEIGLPAPDRDVERPRIVLVDERDDETRGFRVVTGAERLAAAVRIPGADAIDEHRGRREAFGVSREPLVNGTVRVDDLADEVRARRLLAKLA